MAELLSLKDDRLWDASLAATGRVGWMEPAVVINCISLILRECAILTSLVTCMGLCTLLLHLRNGAIEGFMCTIGDHPSVLNEAVCALLVRPDAAATFLSRPNASSLANTVRAVGGAGVVASPTGLLLLCRVFILLTASVLSSGCTRGTGQAADTPSRSRTKAGLSSDWLRLV